MFVIKKILNNKFKIYWSLMIMFVFFLSISYAFLSEQINISGVANISATWDIKFTKSDIKSSHGAEVNNINFTDTTTNYDVTFLSPGSFVELEFTISNKGTIDAILLDINTSQSISYANVVQEKSGIDIGDIIRSNEEIVMMLKIEWVDEISQFGFEEINFQIELDFMQASLVSEEFIFDNWRAPYINLFGESYIELSTNSEYIEPGYVARDSYGNDLTGDVVVENPLDTKTPGIYDITYSVTDEFGMLTSDTRRIYVKNESLIAHFPLSGNTADISFNQNNGINVNSQLSNDRFNNVNQAYAFNGNSYLEVPSIESYNELNEFTVSAWIYRTADQVNQWASIINIDRDNGINLQHNQTNSLFEFAVRTDDNRRWITGAPEGGIENNRWYHLTGVYDGSYIILYVDGIEVARSVLTGVTNSFSSPLLIGTWGDNSIRSRGFSGKIDDVKFYNKALSQEEVFNTSQYIENELYTVTYLKNIEEAGTLDAYTKQVYEGGYLHPNVVNSNDNYNFVNYTIISGNCFGYFNNKNGSCTNVGSDLSIRVNFSHKFYKINYELIGSGVIKPEVSNVLHARASSRPMVGYANDYNLTSFYIVEGSCHGNFDNNTGICDDVRDDITIRAVVVLSDFFDNFSNENLSDDWVVHSGEVSIENQSLKLRANSNSIRPWVSLINKHSLATIDLNWYSDHNANSGSDMRLKFLANGTLNTSASWSQTGYQIQWETWISGTPLVLYRLEGSTSVRLGSFNLDVIQNRNRWNKMKIIITNNEINIFHNNQLVISSTDNKYRQEGELILGGREGSGRTVFYDNVKISG